MTGIAAIILAAGKGTRMKAPIDKNKVTFEIANHPMIWYGVETLKKLSFDQIIAVVGFANESVRSVLNNSVEYVIQDLPKGTGHAVKVALPAIKNQVSDVVVMYGDDSAFYNTKLFNSLINEHKSNKSDLTIVTLEVDNPLGLGRVKRNQEGQVIEVVEEKNATEDEKKIREINTGLYCFTKEFLAKALDNLKENEVSHEYYLTDVIKYARDNNYSISALKWPDPDIWCGVNTPEQLKVAEAKMAKLIALNQVDNNN